MSGVVDLRYVRFAVPDLEKQTAFLEDFGLQVTRQGDVLYARGTDANPVIYSAEAGDAAFLGLGFEVETQQDLEQIAAVDAVSVTDNPAPGGGLIASLNDPDGVRVDIVWGMQKPTELPPAHRSPINDGLQQSRLGERVTLDMPACSVKRLGHCVMMVSDYQASRDWYQARFGLIVSDEIYVESKDNVIGAFLRCNRGERYVDHHTLFLLGAPQPGFNHAAFEISNWDALMYGHHQLQQAGYQHSWGVGKHVLGSQVFDYWKDPHDFTLEHFTDGDLFNEGFGSHSASIEQLMQTHWGPAGAP